MQITLRTSIENLKIGENSSQLSCQSFIEFGYFGVHFSVTFSSASRAFSSFAAWQIVFRSVENAFRSLSETYLSVLRTICAMQRCCSVFGNAADMASLMPVSPSEQRMRISFTPRFFSSFRTESQYLELSFSRFVYLNLLIDTGDILLPLFYYLWLKRGLPVLGHLDVPSSLDVILLNRPEAQEQIKALSAQGKTIREISAETGIPKSTVQRLKKNV